MNEHSRARYRRRSRPVTRRLAQKGKVATGLMSDMQRHFRIAVADAIFGNEYIDTGPSEGGNETSFTSPVLPPRAYRAPLNN